MTGLYVDSIKDKSNTKTLATLSNSAITLHTDVTFPAGMIIKEQAFDEVAYITALSASSWSSGNTISFTKLKASSDSYIIYNWNGYVSKYTNSGSYIDWRMAYTPNGGSQAFTAVRNFDHNNNNPAESRIHFPMCIQYHIDTLNAGTHTFIMQALWGGPVGYNNNSQLQTDTEQYIIIKEVSK